MNTNNTNNTNNAFDPCLDEQELRAYAAGEDTGVRDRSVIRSHLNICDACRERLDNTTKRPDSLENLFKRSVQFFRDKQEHIREATKRGPVPGTIWRTKPNPDDQDELIGTLVLVMDSEDTPDGHMLSVVEVSEALTQATKSDIPLLPKRSGMSFPAMIRTENAFLMARAWIKSFVAELPAAFWQKVRELIFERQQMPREDLVSTETDPQVAFLRESIEKRQYLTASPITSTTTSLYERLQQLVPEDPTTREPTWEEMIAPPGSEPGVMIRFLSPRPEPVRRTTGTQEQSARHWLVGETLSVMLEVRADGHVVVFSFAETGSVTLEYPCQPDHNTAMSTGDKRKITRTVTGPEGNYGLRAFWTTQALLDPSQVDFGDVASVEQAIRLYCDSVSALDPKEWQDAVYEYTVREAQKEGSGEDVLSKASSD